MKTHTNIGVNGIVRRSFNVRQQCVRPIHQTGNCHRGADSGEARYSAGDNVWHPLVAGKVLRSGAVIQSAADSTVDIILGVVPVQVAYPNSTMQPAGLANAADPNVRGYIVYNPKVSQNVVRMYGNTVLAVDKLTLSGR